MTFFLFLFFGVFFALLLIGIQASSGLRIPNSLQNSIKPTVSKSDVEQFGNVEDITSIIEALKRRSESPVFSDSSLTRSSALSYGVQLLREDVDTIKVQLYAFKLIVSGFAFVFGFAAAFVALTSEITLP